MQLTRGVAQVAAPQGARALPVPSRAIRSRRPQPFSGRRVVVAAAAEASEAPKQQQQQRQRRAPRSVTVDIATIQPGQEFEGTVSSVEAYGAFVNIGAETDGLVHVSQLTDRYVKNVADVVKVGAKVRVKVLTCDPAQRRLALTMKGMGNAAAGGAAGPAAAAASFEEDAEDDGADAGFALEAGDVAFDGVVFRVEDDAAETEGYDEGDEYEAAAEGEIALAAAVVNTIVEGTVASVEDFGVVVEWTDTAGAKRSGLLHVSEMRAPAAAAEAEAGEGAAAAAAEDAGGMFADEGEFVSELYVDVGGVDKPSRYYKVGDPISCYVAGVDGHKLELTQDLASLALDDAVDEEGEEDDAEEDRLLAAAEGDSASGLGAVEDEDGEPMDTFVPNAEETSAAIYYSASAAAAKAAGAPAFVRGKRGAAVAPGAFPSRGAAVSELDLIVPAARRLVDVDDAGDESELVEFWSADDAAAVRKGALSRLGVKIVETEEGESEVVPREDDGASDEDKAVAAMELLSGVTDADLDALVDLLMGDEEEDEAEVPFKARRNPGSRA